MTETALFRIEHIQADDSGDIQTVNAYGHTNERLEGIIRVQPHGFSSNPPVGSHGLGLRLRGQSDLAVALGLEDPTSRPKNLGVGQSAIYDAGGNITRYQCSDGIWHDAGSNPQKLTGRSIALEASTGDASVGSSSGKTYLGGNGQDGTYAAVMTESGPSSTVFCKL